MKCSHRHSVPTPHYNTRMKLHMYVYCRTVGPYIVLMCIYIYRYECMYVSYPQPIDPIWLENHLGASNLCFQPFPRQACRPKSPCRTILFLILECSTLSSRSRRFRRFKKRFKLESFLKRRLSIAWETFLESSIFDLRWHLKL